VEVAKGIKAKTPKVEPIDVFKASNPSVDNGRIKGSHVWGNEELLRNVYGVRNEN
jgi:hypothetical protein